jgi:hypothetical protein
MDRPVETQVPGNSTVKPRQNEAAIEEVGRGEECRLSAALMQRDALVTLLIAQSQRLIQRLALLAGVEKAAVVGLVTIGQAMIVYARAVDPDPQVMASFDQLLVSLSPASAGRIADPLSLNSVVRESCTYAGAIDACLRAGEGHAQRNHATIGEAVAEAERLSRDIKQLLVALVESADQPIGRTGFSCSVPVRSPSEERNR